ncbi:DinB family protein [Evansella halocellulosilytica]|uniref:DinB family protein n=1 Tax=Evansella halocellulosilytica TaxID=2011013 RepID=UPI0027BA026F|nr:DinB family protein [Evansella halocellulosilytica]
MKVEKRHEILFTQLKSYRDYFLYELEDVTEKEAEIIPTGFKNNIRWNIGHVYIDQYLWVQVLTKEKGHYPESFNSWFGFRTSPKNFTADTPSFGQLKALLEEQPAKIQKQYGNRLDEEFEPTEMGMYTLEQVLVRTIYHEGMHTQSILDLKKCIRAN